MKDRVIAWWSGGIASAVACRLALEMFPVKYFNVVIVFIETNNEHDDTGRFLKDCEKVYGKEIMKISSDKWYDPSQVWDECLTLNNATGAKCSSELKFNVRKKFQNILTDHAQVFGFDHSESNRHLNMRKNYIEINPISPLISQGYTKEDCKNIVISWGIEIPEMYKLGFQNNNCFKTGCVQGGVGYWQKIQREFPYKYEAMAKREHDLTNKKGKPVTCIRLKRDGEKQPFFLKKHPDYKYHIGMVEGRQPKALMECNGFCHTTEPIEE